MPRQRNQRRQEVTIHAKPNGNAGEFSRIAKRILKAVDEIEESIKDAQQHVMTGRNYLHIAPPADTKARRGDHDEIRRAWRAFSDLQNFGNAIMAASKEERNVSISSERQDDNENS